MILSKVKHMSAYLTRLRSRPTLLVGLLLALYILLFTLNSFQIHKALLTNTSDLGQIDLAVWNTSRGRFVQEIKGETLSTRLTDHVEPIWIPISLIYWLWDDVRALLFLQTLALAGGAWPLYLLARRRLRLSDERILREKWRAAQQRQRSREPTIVRERLRPPQSHAGWSPIILVLIYLLFPALEAANLTEVHAIPFAVPLILFALWFVESRQWWRFAIAALLVAAVKEEAALLAAMLALYALWRARSSQPASVPDAATTYPPASRAGPPAALIALSVFLLSLLWFYLATFVIVPAHAAQAYGVSESTYFQRYGPLGNSAGDIFKSLLTRPGAVWAVASTPGRIAYLFGLFLSTGLLAFFGPELLFLAAPLLLANILSTFQAQWSGELHYSAPLVPYFMAAALLGLERLARGWSRRSSLSVAVAANRIALIALVIALGYHLRAGWTPLGANWQWPEVTPHARGLNRFLDQIPPDAPAAATTALVPHLSHRQFIYTLPNLGQAQWVLADVSGTTDMHPAALQELLRGLLDEGWGVVDAADGYILLLARGGATTIPDAFYQFAFVSPADLQLDQAVNATWPGGLVYLGYRLDDQPKWGLTRITHYVQAGSQPLSPYFFVASSDGEIVDDSIMRPPPALQWLPPARWPPGQILAFSSAWFLPDIWRPAVAFAEPGNEIAPAADPAQRLEPLQVQGQSPWEVRERTLWLQAWRRPALKQELRRLAADLAVDPRDLRPPPGGATVWLQTPPPPVQPGQQFNFRIGWYLDKELTQPYTIFVHFLDGEGKRMAQRDSTPHHFYAIPTTTWPARQPVYTGHTLALPTDLPPGRYDLVVGLYDPDSGQRLTISRPGGQPTDAVILRRIRVHRGDGVSATLGQ